MGREVEKLLSGVEIEDRGHYRETGVLERGSYP